MEYGIWNIEKKKKGIMSSLNDSFNNSKLKERDNEQKVVADVRASKCGHLVDRHNKLEGKNS